MSFYDITSDTEALGAGCQQFLKFSHLFLPESGVSFPMFMIRTGNAMGIRGDGNGWVLFSSAYFLMD